MAVNKLKKNIINKDDGFLVQFLYIIFYWAERISVFYLIRVIGKKLAEKKNNKPFVMTYIFPEIWAVGNLIFASCIAFYILKIFNVKWLAWILMVYAICRTVELIVYQINVLFFHRLNSEFREIGINSNQSAHYKIKSATRTVLLLILNMAEYIFQFAVIFAAIGIVIEKPEMNIGMLKSFELFMNMSKVEDFKEVTYIFPLYIEILIGIFMNIVCLARFIGMLPKLDTVEKEK